jgi:phosphate transport system permease protein
MLYARRRLVNRLALTIATAAAAFGLAWLIWILGTLFYNGISAINLGIFTEMTPPPGDKGGLLNAIFGSIILTIGATVLSTPIGMLAGTYLAEYGKKSTLAEIVRFINDILLSAPSIVVGLFIYEVLVVPMGHFSAWAGVVVLAVIAVPVIVRTTEDMLNLVPNGLREAASALGTPMWKVVVMIAYRAARNGIITGILLAIARVSGETAPLLFTALNNQFWSTDFNAPMASLPVTIFQFALSPYDDWQSLAWGGALIITVTILILNIVARALATLGSSKG